MLTVGWPRLMMLPDASPLWLAACRAKEEQARGLCAVHDADDLDARWERASGVAAADTRFTLVLPIHDEERSLPSVLHALLCAWLPREADVSVALVTNACSDASPQQVVSFLDALAASAADGATGADDADGTGGAAATEATELTAEALGDAGLRGPARAVRMGGVEFLHLDTATPGKANALELGNAVARARGHAVALSLDTNNWIEPDALAVLYGDAHRGLHGRDMDPAGGTAATGGEAASPIPALWYATPVPVFRVHRGSLYNRMQRRQAGTPARAEGERLELPGWMLAWDVEWLQASGGVPRTATEDFALAVLARATGRAVGVSEARVWGYGISTLGDLLSGARRFVRGELQLRALAAEDPDFAAAAEQQILHARPFAARFRRFRALVARRPLRFPVQLVKWLVWETGLALGRRDYRRDPKSSSWKAIGSTK